MSDRAKVFHNADPVRGSMYMNPDVYMFFAPLTCFHLDYEQCGGFCCWHVHVNHSNMLMQPRHACTSHHMQHECNAYSLIHTWPLHMAMVQAFRAAFILFRDYHLWKCIMHCPCVAGCSGWCPNGQSHHFKCAYLPNTVLAPGSEGTSG